MDRRGETARTGKNNEDQTWLYLKGKKTPEGLKRSSMNALKHGMRSAEMIELQKQLAELNSRKGMPEN